MENMETVKHSSPRLHVVDYDESHWNGSTGRKYFATPQAAHAYARRLQTAWCRREATGRIVATLQRKDGRREDVSYSVS